MPLDIVSRLHSFSASNVRSRLRGLPIEPCSLLKQLPEVTVSIEPLQTCGTLDLRNNIITRLATATRAGGDTTSGALRSRHLDEIGITLVAAVTHQSKRSNGRKLHTQLRCADE